MDSTPCGQPVKPTRPHIRTLWDQSYPETSFEVWTDLLDRTTLWFYGVPYRELPDLLLYYDAWRQGQSPLQFVREEVSLVIQEEFGVSEPLRPFPVEVA